MGWSDEIFKLRISEMKIIVDMVNYPGIQG